MYSEPEFFKMYRANLEPVDHSVFDHIHRLVGSLVARDHTSMDFVEYVGNEEIELDERATITNYQGRLVEAHLLAPDHKLGRVGATAIVGVALQPELPVGSLWVMSSEKTYNENKHWMLEHTMGYPITTGEAEKLQQDLTNLLAS